MNSETLGQPISLNFTGIPIFVIQFGEPGLFLNTVLKQAQLTNGKENVYLLTDNLSDYYEGINCIDVSGYIQVGSAFDDVYSHHSTNTSFFEKACFDRWFILNTLVKEHGISYFFHADGDVLILEDLTRVYREHLENKYEGTTMFFENGENSISSGHSSFWSSELLERFCSFTHQRYADKEKFSLLLRETAEGKFYDNRNMSDMILLDAFRKETQPNTLNLLLLEEKNMCFDFNINASYNGCRNYYLISSFFGIKKISRKKDGLYCTAKRGDGSKEDLKFYTLHFQGYLGKALIPAYVSSSDWLERMRNYAMAMRTFLRRKGRLLYNKMNG